jgi:hypothetical protein
MVPICVTRVMNISVGSANSGRCQFAPWLGVNARSILIAKDRFKDVADGDRRQQIASQKRRRHPQVFGFTKKFDI